MWGKGAWHSVGGGQESAKHPTTHWTAPHNKALSVAQISAEWKVETCSSDEELLSFSWALLSLHTAHRATIQALALNPGHLLMVIPKCLALARRLSAPAWF